MSAASRYKTLFLLLLVVGLISRRLYQRFWDSNLHVTFFDVGQGDAALIQFKGGKTMLIDAGGGNPNRNMGNRELFLELARQGILTLDIALLTHPDQDHGMGFLGIFEGLQVKEMWYNAAFDLTIDRHPVLRNLMQVASRQRTLLKNWVAPVSLNVNGADLSLFPLQDPGVKTNNKSLVMLLEFSGCRLLFTGDIETASEQRLIGLLPEITLLKVAHHGSWTSSSENFLTAISPRFAVISAGLNNRYGHPHRWVLRRFGRHRTQIFRTDFHGFVKFTISPGGRIWCRTFLGDCGVAMCAEHVLNPQMPPFQLQHLIP